LERSFMGSVRDLYTTGDNDPEIEPVQYYRHYLYCDACGSFGLEPWTTGDPALKRVRKGLGLAALVASPLVAVSLWSVLGFVLSPAVLLWVAAGMIIAPVLRGWVSPESAAKRWHFVGWSLVAIAALSLASVVVPDLLSPRLVFLAETLLIIGFLSTRALVKSKVEYLGRRCRQCAATYAYGTPFFTDLDANPRHLTVADVPRPLGSSPFERGKSVD
jgi:hypothetical protein